MTNIKAHGITLTDAVLAYRVLKSAKIDSDKETLPKATISDLTYDMKKKLRSIFDITLLPMENENRRIKEDEVYYSGNS